MTVIWLLFFSGVLIRLGDRIEHSCAATVGPSEKIKTPWDYISANRWKIAIRLFGGVILFWVLMDIEQVGKITALLAGFSYETSVESIQQRASRNGQKSEDNGKGKE